MNKAVIEIDNCCDCLKHYQERMYTPDSFEHEEGVYCSIVEDKDSLNGKHRLVAGDNRNVREYCDIPDWCPIKKTQEDNVNIWKTSDKNIPKGCSSYNYKDGTCKDTNKLCDACYSCHATV